MILQESQTVEFKELWRDEYLKTVCAFANTDGGVLYIGVNDKGEVIGVDGIKKLIEDLPNKVMNTFVIAIDVEAGEENGKQFVKMTVHKSKNALSYHGKFYIRSGSTTQELKGGALQKLLLKANNLFWDEIEVDNATYDDIDAEMVTRFVVRATEYNRLPLGINSKNIKQLFQNLKLTTIEGKLTRAAILLFGKKPTRFFSCATFKIGRFRGTDPTDLIIQDKIEGNLFAMFEQVIDFLKSKYLLSPISYQGMQRLETLEIPDKAIREAILNSMIHRDYTSPAAISLRVYDSTVSIWNDGELEKLNIEDLSREHDSYQRNPLIADIFYRAGYIEAWGRGTLMIIEETTKSGLPQPTFQARQGGLEVIFQRNTMRFSDKKLDEPTLKLSLRQQKAVEYVKKNGSISNKIYQELTKVSKRTATNDLVELVQNLVFEKQGSSGENIKYFLVGQQWGNSGATVGQQWNQELDEPNLKLSLRQQKAVEYVRTNGSISNKIYQELAGVSKRTATNDLAELVQNLVFDKQGSSGENIKYILVGQ
jgi:ATP-dependent DNA helicase RecG